MPHDVPPGPPNLQHDHLRSALEFAVRSAAAWQKRKPPLPVPAAIRPFGKQPRLQRWSSVVPGASWTAMTTRKRLAAAAVPELVDDIGIVVVPRPGWEDRAATLVELRRHDAEERDLERQLAQEQRRRAAAEDVATRTRAEVVALTERLAEREAELQALRRRQSSGVALRRTVAEAGASIYAMPATAEPARRTIERGVGT